MTVETQRVAPVWFSERLFRYMTMRQAEAGNLRAIARWAAWRAENALNRYFAACRIVYSEGRVFHGRPA